MPLKVWHGYFFGSQTLGAVLKRILLTSISRITLLAYEKPTLRVRTAKLLPLSKMLRSHARQQVIDKPRHKILFGLVTYLASRKSNTGQQGTRLAALLSIYFALLTSHLCVRCTIIPLFITPSWRRFLVLL